MMCGCRRHGNTDAPCTCKCDHLGVVAKTRRYWKGGRGWTVVESIAVDNRPHVLIDPEDREQAERLADALVAAMCRQDPDWDKARAFEVRSHMRSALREFANPTPKPDEPTGLGAVVEDVEGQRWIRGSSMRGLKVWVNDDALDSEWRSYRDIAAVKELNAGWTE